MKSRLRINTVLKFHACWKFIQILWDAVISNSFSDWRRTGHVPLVKTQWRPRTDKTQWRPRATTPWPWTFDAHVIRLCTLKPRQICKPAIEVGQRFSLEKAFIIQENWGIYNCKTYQINKGKIFYLLCLQNFLPFVSRPSMFPSASPRGTLRVSGKQNSLFPLGRVI